MRSSILPERIPNVLVVDDQFEMAETVADGLAEFGFRGTAVSNSTDALALVARGEHDAVVTDLRMPSVDGLAILAKSRESAPGCPVIVMTAFSDVDTAVESIRRGAYHYMTKPFKVAELALFLKRGLDESALRREAKVLKTALHSPLQNVVGKSREMQEIFELVRRVADSEVPVLVVGETGTGKGLIARALHSESARVDQAFVSVNCAAIPENLLESELFGHVRGAFTGAASDRMGLFEQAHRGTLFLDEIAEMSTALQAKLLHVIETGSVRPVGSNSIRQVDVRIVAATHRDLRDRVVQGLFREDLLYRLDVISIDLPALRHRADDIPLLAEHFLAAARQRHSQSPLRRLSGGVMETFMNAPWRGNVRELEHVVERLALLCHSGEATIDDLPKNLSLQSSDRGELHFGERIIPIRELQRRYASWALQRMSGAKLATCEALGIDSKTLSKWLRSDSVSGED